MDKRPVFPPHFLPLPECHTLERMSIAQLKLTIELALPFTEYRNSLVFLLFCKQRDGEMFKSLIICDTSNTLRGFCLQT